jgi:hypothetical protein
MLKKKLERLQSDE